ncbi:MAG: hypothetical protein WCG27_05405 [Pseudomonadota bacterium]
MGRRNREVFQYKCTITEQVYSVTRPAPHPTELISVKAWYQLNPDQDDRPDSIKKQLEISEPKEPNQ